MLQGKLVILGLAGFFSLFLYVPQAVWATTYTVNSTDDTNDGTCTSVYVDASNDCTMREAINAANLHIGADTITISIDPSAFSSTSDGHGQWTTTVTSSYNALTGQTTFDATGMWDGDENRPGFRLYSLSTSLAALTFNSGSGSSQVKGFEIDGYNAGINIASGANNISIGTDCDGTSDGIERNVLHNAINQEIRIQSTGVVVAGNYLGIDDDGTTVTHAPLYGVWISGAGADSNTIGFREGQTCTAAQQRNVISGAGTVGGYGVYLLGTGTLNSSGDASLGPNGNTVAGNYIGLDATGTTSVANVGAGVAIGTNATLNVIGTDGDGTSDASEQNVISGNTIGVFISNTGTNRVSGNLVGVNAAGTAALANTNAGINVRGTGNILGWCDTTINSTVCSDTGALANQRNVISGNGTDGIRLGYTAYNTAIYGNYIGVATDGSTSLGNTESGIFIHRGNTGNLIGGSNTNQTNVIQANAYGVRIDGEFIGSASRGDASGQVAPSNNTIQNNTIQKNGVGIYNYWTENYSTDGPTDNTLTGNTISNNTSNGIEVYGSSPAVTNNTISNNASYGIYIHPALVTYDSQTEATATDGANPANAAHNLISRPTITGNTISSNTSGGIYQFDSRANNYTTLATDNTIGNNSNQFDIRQDWLGAIEVIDRNGAPLPSSALSGTTVTLTPTAGGSAVSLSASSTTSSSGLTQNIFGPSGVSYTDVSTWSTITEYVIDVNGSQTTYGPYTISTDGTYRSGAGNTYSYDGTDNDTTYTNTLANGITTDSMYRYQIGKVMASTVPSTPSTISPTGGAIGQSLTPTLAASSFSDASNDSHASSTWRLYSSSTTCAAGGTGDVLNVVSSSSLTTYAVGSGVLKEETTYYWSVAYTNSFGNRSDFSSCGSFTTIRTTPTFSGTIPNQTWEEDTNTNNAFDLDSYFSDAEGEALTFSVLSSDTPSNLTVSISVSGQVSFAPEENFSGTRTVTFRACDTESECQNSNQVTLTVTEVNDAPAAVEAGFSPCCGDTTTDLTPDISWTATTDGEDQPEELTYEFILGTAIDPATNPIFTGSTQAGVTSAQVVDNLSDETTYYYKVRAVDADGAAADWSAVQEFYVNTAIAPALSLSKQAAVSSTSWFFQVYQWVSRWSAFIPSLFPAQTQAQAPNPQTYSRTGDTVVSTVTPVGAAAVMIETLIGMFLLAFAVAFLILLRQSRHPKQFLALLFGNPASTFFSLFMGDNITIEAISYAHFKAKLQLTRWLLAAAVVGVAALAIIHTAFAPYSPIAAQIASQVSSGNVEPSDVVTITITYQNTGDGDATNAVITDSLPSGTTFVSGSAVVNDVLISDSKFFSGSQVYVSLGTIGDRDSSSDTGTVRYQIKVDNPFEDAHLSIPNASLSANEIVSATASNSLSFDAVSAQISGSVLDSSTGVGLSNVHLKLSQGDTALVQHVTNKSGSYSFSGIGDGEYVLSVELVSGYDKATQRQLTIDAGDVVSIDFQLNATASGDDNTNGNTNNNSNQNTNENINENSNENLNTNTNTNSNTNLNTNTNTNLNSNTNSDTNTNTNTNSNANTNSNTNSNANTNADKNTNGGKNPPDTDDEFPTTPELTPEQEELQNDLSSSLDLNSINDTPVSNHTLGFLGANSLAGLPAEYSNNLDKILLPEDENVVLSGHSLPGSQVTITICSAAYVQVTQTDADGTWNMIVPRTLFEEGEHVAVATAEKEGVTTTDLEIARFVVLDQLAITSRPALVIGLNVLLLSLFANLVLWGARRGRLKQGDPLLPEFTPTPEEQQASRRRFFRAFGLYMLAIAAFVAIFFIPHPRLFNMRTTTPADGDKIVLTSINQQRVIPGTTQNFSYVSTLHLAGIAPADTQIAITLCPGVTFRSTASGPDGEWAMDIPLIVLPKGQFSLQAQVDEDNVLGIPHVMADFKINNIQVLPRDWALYLLSGLCAILGSFALWAPSRKEQSNLPIDFEPSDVAPAE